MTQEDVVLAGLGYLQSAGWGTYHPDEIIEEVDEMLAIAGRFRAGDIVERRLHDVRLRVPAASR